MSLINFPLPYPDELIYSVIARYGVHFALTSPKQLLDDVFGNRKVIATVDFSDHVNLVARHYDRGVLSTRKFVESLIYQHTLFPLHSSFVEEKRRLQCLNWMSDSSKGSVHLALGVAASKIKRVSSLRYCPQCLIDQMNNHGEHYWAKSWQVQGIESCAKHGKLGTSNISLKNRHRHQYFPLIEDGLVSDIKQKPASKECLSLSYQVAILLNMHPRQSPTFQQWTTYYHDLAISFNCINGANVFHDSIKEQVLSKWTQDWLEQYDLGLNEKETCWLKSIFRKHRKSFSYLQHLIVLEAFLENNWSIEEVINDVSVISQHNRTNKSQIAIKSFDVLKRNQWKQLLKTNGPMFARNQPKGGGLYAWLYRHDRDWLMSINKKYQLPVVSINTRVNWSKRDRQVVKILIKERRLSTIQSPRMSRNWVLTKLASNASIDKNLDKLPLCKEFFKRYCEDVGDYQIRRIDRTANLLSQTAEDIFKWKLLRYSGLSKERITAKASKYLEDKSWI